MDISKMKLNVDENIERVAELPEEYIKAVEDIVGFLDPDWRNKLVYNKYIAYLCNVFEDAIKKGLSVEEVIGSDRKAYAEKIQKELKFMDIEPTDTNRIVNFLIVLDFIMYVGMTIFTLGNTKLADAESMGLILMGIGTIIFLVCTILKINRVKSIKKLMILPIVQFIFTIVIMPVLNYEILSSALALVFNLLTDYMLVAKRQQ